MIQIITGLPGFGKTLTASRWAYKLIKKGKKKVYANYPLKGAEYYVDILDVLGKVKNALIVVDEAGVVLDQLRMYNLPLQTWIELRQHRKDGVDLLMTAQSMYDVAYPLRRLIQTEYNIFFKMGPFTSVTVRNPQRGGDYYGKRIWYISRGVYSLYDSWHKVGLEQPEDDEILNIDQFQHYRHLQERLLEDSISFLK